MAGFEQKSFHNADEKMTFLHGEGAVVEIGGGKVGHALLRPGWRWSIDVKPRTGTDLCMAPHFQYQLTGTMHVVMADGTEFDTHAGDVLVISPGHDAWVVGDETVEAIDWGGAHIWGQRIAE